jgi:hypothetical protein
VNQQNTDLGITLNNLKKIDTDPPLWILTVNGKNITMPSTQSLINQGEFKAVCVEKLAIIPNKIKAAAWDKTIKDLLAHIEVISAPRDASAQGQLKGLIENFLVIRERTIDKEEINLRKVVDVDGMLYFRSQDLLQYLKQQGCKEADKPHALWRVVREFGGSPKTFRTERGTVRTWGVPEASLDMRDIEYEVTMLNDDEEM